MQISKCKMKMQNSKRISKKYIVVKVYHNFSNLTGKIILQYN